MNDLIANSHRTNSGIELSIVMPCLNEADTLEICLTKARTAIDEAGIQGEIIVADNGSTDGSIDIANRNGAVVVSVAEKGYGSALIGGIAAARGKYVIMGDADDSYDFLETPKFVKSFAKATTGTGLPASAGGGTIKPGAMPFLHRWWGNPMFSLLVKRWFRAPINDVYCGFRGFTKDHYLRLEQRCTGMEFATEMIIKSSIYRDSMGVRIAEVPITLHPDGRKSHAPHLKTFRDGWRTLRFFLMYSPRWLFLIPGILLMLLGLVGYVVALPQMRFGAVVFDAHTLLFASLFILCGFQSVLFAILTKTFAISEGLMPDDPKMNRFFEIVNLERGLIVAGLALLVGVVLLLLAINVWRHANFGPLNYAETMRYVIPGATLVALGFQTVLWGFFVSILGMKRK